MFLRKLLPSSVKWLPSPQTFQVMQSFQSTFRPNLPNDHQIPIIIVSTTYYLLPACKQDTIHVRTLNSTCESGHTLLLTDLLTHGENRSEGRKIRCRVHQTKQRRSGSLRRRVAFWKRRENRRSPMVEEDGFICKASEDGLGRWWWKDLADVADEEQVPMVHYNLLSSSML